MIADHLDWDNPGAAPYQGTFIEWVKNLPEPQQGQMMLVAPNVLAKVPKYDAIVYITRDDISDASGSSDYVYAPEIIFMASGTHGTIYRDTSRKNWSPAEIQSAMLFCTLTLSGWEMCAARPSICNNWSIIFRRQLEAAPPDSFEVGYVAPVVAPPPAKEGVVSPVPTSPDVPDEGPIPIPSWGVGGGYPGGFYGFVGGGGGGGGGYAPCPVCTPQPPCPVPLSPIPEPGSWLLLAGGLALLASIFNRRKGKQ